MSFSDGAFMRLFGALVGGFLASLVIILLLVGLSVADDYLFGKRKNTESDGEDESVPSRKKLR